jgi:hypothetical protein
MARVTDLEQKVDTVYERALKTAHQITMGQVRWGAMAMAGEGLAEAFLTLDEIMKINGPMPEVWEVLRKR